MIARPLLVAVTTLAMSAGAASAAPGSGAAAGATAKANDTRPVGGDRRRIVGILDVRVEGVPKEIARQFQLNLEKQLDSKAYWLAPQQRVREMMANSTKWTEGCVVGGCLSEVKTQTGADIVLLASITGSGTSFGYVVTLMRTDTGTLVAQETNRCEVCTVNEALANATLAAVKLVTAVPDALPAEAVPRAELEAMTTKLESEHAATKRAHRTVGITMTLAGLVAAGAGMTVYFVKDRADAGLAVAGIGAGLTVGGVVTLTF